MLLARDYCLNLPASPTERDSLGLWIFRILHLKGVGMRQPIFKFSNFHIFTFLNSFILILKFPNFQIRIRSVTQIVFSFPQFQIAFRKFAAISGLENK